MLSPVASYAEAVQRQGDNGCEALVIPREVMQEMIAVGVGPQVD